jgi:hypothetical protein
MTLTAELGAGVSWCNVVGCMDEHLDTFDIIMVRLRRGEGLGETRKST